MGDALKVEQGVLFKELVGIYSLSHPFIVSATAYFMFTFLQCWRNPVLLHTRQIFDQLNLKKPTQSFLYVLLKLCVCLCVFVYVFVCVCVCVICMLVYSIHKLGEARIERQVSSFINLHLSDLRQHLSLSWKLTVGLSD